MTASFREVGVGLIDMDASHRGDLTGAASEIRRFALHKSLDLEDFGLT